jgi:hypothetical protein
MWDDAAQPPEDSSADEKVICRLTDGEVVNGYYDKVLSCWVVDEGQLPVIGWMPLG